jgi:outer membrane protein
MKRFSILCGLFIIMLAVSSTAVAQAALKIGVVDFQTALNQVNEGKSAKKNLEAEFKRKQKQLDIQQKELENMKNDLQKQAAVLPQEKLQAKQGEFQQKFLALRQKAGEYQKEMMQKEAELSGKILGRLKEIIGDIGQKEDFTLIVEKSNDPVLYVESKHDLTSRVIKAYNSKY